MSNRVFMLSIGVLVIISGFLLKEIFVLREIPDSDVYPIYLDAFERSVADVKKECYNYYEQAKLLGKISTNPGVLAAMKKLDKIISFGDSAVVYIDQLESLQDDPDSARLCFENYVRFYDDFYDEMYKGTRFEQLHREGLRDNTLPGEEPFFDEKDCVKVIALFSRYVLYDRMKGEMVSVASFTL